MHGPKVAFNNAGHVDKNNDISKIVENLSTSTNNALIIGLLERGISEIYQFNSSSVRLEGRFPLTDAVKLRLTKKVVRVNKRERPLAYGNVACSYIETIKMKLDKFDVIFIRGDDIEPNSDVIKLFKKAQKPLYVDSPEGTLATKDKFEIKRRAKKVGIKIPETYNVTDFEELLKALGKIRRKYKVIKARYGYGGRKVWRVNLKTPEEKLRRIFEHCDGGVVVQEYRPIIKNGDLRLNVFDGNVLGNGAILRQTTTEEWKTNIDLGGSQTPYMIDDEIRTIAKKVSEAYPKARLQGIDLFLDGTFIETNAYPSTVGYTQEHFGIKARDIILDAIDGIPNKA